MIKLNVKDRLLIMANMPESGSIAENRAIKRLSNILPLTEGEKILYDLKEENGKITWNYKGFEEKVFNLNKQDIMILKEIVTGLDEDGLVTVENFETVDKIDTIEL